MAMLKFMINHSAIKASALIPIINILLLPLFTSLQIQDYTLGSSLLVSFSISNSNC